MTFARVLFLAASLGVGCGDAAGVDELEELLREAAECDPGDACAVVDTYCCPRPVNAERLDEVLDELERAPTDESECLADCIGTADQLYAKCEPDPLDGSGSRCWFQ